MSLHHPPLADAPSNPSGEKLGPVRWLYRIGTIAAVLVAITLVGVTLQALRHEPLLREQFAGQLGGHLARLALAVAFGLLAVAVIWRARPTEPTLLFAVSAAFVAWLYGYAFFAGALAWTQRQVAAADGARRAGIFGLRVWVDILTFVPLVAGPLAFLHFTRIYPRRLTPDELTTPLPHLFLGGRLGRVLGLRGFTAKGAAPAAWELWLFWAAVAWAWILWVATGRPAALPTAAPVSDILVAVTVLAAMRPDLWILHLRRRVPHPSPPPAPAVRAVLFTLYAAFLVWATAFIRPIIGYAGMAGFAIMGILWLMIVVAMLGRVRATLVVQPISLMVVPAALFLAGIAELVRSPEPPVFEGFPMVGLVAGWSAACGLVGLANFGLGFAHGTPDDRRRARWMAAGFVTATLAVLAGWAADLLAWVRCGGERTDWLCGVFAALSRAPALALPLLVACLGISVFYKGEIDSRVVIRGASVYGLVAVLLAVGFGILEHLLSEWLGGALPHGGPKAVAAGACALAMHPVRHGCERAVSRLLGRVLAAH
jgi:hypothetical protein